MTGLGTHLQRLREDKGLSLRDVERLTGYGFADLSKLENDHKLPSVVTAVNLAVVYEVSLDELLGPLVPPRLLPTERHRHNTQELRRAYEAHVELSA